MSDSFMNESVSLSHALPLWTATIILKVEVKFTSIIMRPRHGYTTNTACAERDTAGSSCRALVHTGKGSSSSGQTCKAPVAGKEKVSLFKFSR